MCLNTMDGTRLSQSQVAFSVVRKPRRGFNGHARTVISHSSSSIKKDEWGILKQAETLHVDDKGRQGTTEGELFSSHQKREKASLEHVLETHTGARDTCEVGVHERPLKIAMLLSGGVDSSVALALLRAAGHEVTAFYLQIWFQEDFRNSWDACPWEEDLAYCNAVCDALNVPLKTVHLSSEYWDRVVDHSIGEVKAGRTPNPDMLCNSRVKFGAFYEYLDREYGDEFDRIASGHYARIQRRGDEKNDETKRMVLTPDAVKDQTYFLANLKPEQLDKAMFPLGCFTKPEVRELALCADLPNTSRKDSQGICFLGKVKFDEFIREHIGEWPGPLVEEESNTVVGYHAGYWFYTVGQRKGIHLSGGPWYVTKKDVRNNAVYISRHYNTSNDDAFASASRSRFRCVNMNWLGPMRPQSQRIQCKVRHGPQMYDCTIHEKGMNELIIELDGIDQGLAAGQYAVLYEDSVCLGCGTIMHDDSYVSLSAK